MELLEAYQAGDRLCFYLSGFKDSPRLIVALVEHKGGIAVADANVYDPHSSKCTAFLEGKPTGEGPWKIGRFVVDLIDRHPIAEDQLEFVESLDGKPSQAELEAWLKEQFR